MCSKRPLNFMAARSHCGNCKCTPPTSSPEVGGQANPSTRV
jgi:hypothetical protein